MCAAVLPRTDEPYTNMTVSVLDSPLITDLYDDALGRAEAKTKRYVRQLFAKRAFVDVSSRLHLTGAVMALSSTHETFSL